MQLVVRYDDYGAGYSDACAARLEVEAMLHREMSARGQPWLCAITPRQSVDPHNVDEQRVVDLRDDAARVALIREAVHKGTCVPAVHGLTHHTWKQLPKYGTEFSGLPLERQTEILRRAKREVEAIVERDVTVFVPPWNSFDEATIEAAHRTGFDVLSCGLHLPIESNGSVRLLPATVELIHLRQILDRGRCMPRGSVVVLLMHATDFVSVDRELGYLALEDFGPLLDRAVEALSFEVVDIEAVMKDGAVDLAHRTRSAFSLYRRYKAMSTLPAIGKRVQEWMLPWVSALIPLEAAASLRRATELIIVVWFAGVVAGAAAVGLGAVALTQPGRPRSVIAGLVLVGGLLAASWSARNAALKRFRGAWGTREVGYRTWTALVAGLALALSTAAFLVAI